jgi:murein DD-endopeptidase MepM/ murein hydrolase activator NlpD
MLLVQVLKDMRRAGSWEEEGSDSLGAESLFETLDVELASMLARAKGIGLSKQMEESFDKQFPNLKTQNPNLQSQIQSIQIPGPGSQVPDPGSQVASAAKRGSNPVVGALKAVAHAPAAVAHLVKPVGGAVTSAFGWRRDPMTHAMKFHQGVDLRAAYGQDVQAAAAGRVVFSGDQGAYGTTVVLEHADGTRTRYAHLSARLVEKGDQIAAGAPLGRAGKSGRATGTHVHFEVMAADGRRIAPEQWARTDRADGNPAAVTLVRPIQDLRADAD